MTRLTGRRRGAASDSTLSDVHYRVIRQERRPTAPGYAFGQMPGEAGFYAACDWLRSQCRPADIVMGKPQYLLHLYAGNYTAQLEPTTSARSLENAYIVPQHVRYLLAGHMELGRAAQPEFSALPAGVRRRWSLAWSDPRGSGVRIWKRVK